MATREVTSSEKLQKVFEESLPVNTLPECDVELFLKEKYDSRHYDYRSKYNEEYLEEKLAELEQEIDSDRTLYNGFITLLLGEFYKALADPNNKTQLSIDLDLNNVITNYDSSQRKIIVLAMRWFTNLLIRKHYLVSLHVSPYRCPNSNKPIYLHSIVIRFV